MAMKAVGRDQSERVQRVRAGVTGLAAVLVIAGLAGALFNSASDDPAAVDEAGLQVAGNTATAVEQSVNEPLAELGVAPATAPGNTSTPTAKP